MPAPHLDLLFSKENTGLAVLHFKIDDVATARYAIQRQS